MASGVQPSGQTEVHVTDRRSGAPYTNTAISVRDKKDQGKGKTTKKRTKTTGEKREEKLSLVCKTSIVNFNFKLTQVIATNC